MQALSNAEEQTIKWNRLPVATLKFGLATLRGDDLEKTPVCPTSHKEVGQFYSPAASDIAQNYIVYAVVFGSRRVVFASQVFGGE